MNHYFLAHQNAIPLTLIKCNGFVAIMTRSLLNHGLLEVVIGLTFLAFLGALCNTIDTNYFTTPAYPTSETTLPSFQPRTTPALLFGCQQRPLAPNIAPQINPQPCPSLVSSKKLTRILFAITTFPSFQQRTTPALLFDCQHLPPAPIIALQINLQPWYHQRSWGESSAPSPHQRKDLKRHPAGALPISWIPCPTLCIRQQQGTGLNPPQSSKPLPCPQYLILH